MLKFPCSYNLPVGYIWIFWSLSFFSTFYSFSKNAALSPQHSALQKETYFLPRSRKGIGFVATMYYSKIGFLMWLCFLLFSEDTVVKIKIRILHRNQVPLKTSLLQTLVYVFKQKWKSTGILELLNTLCLEKLISDLKFLWGKWGYKLLKKKSYSLNSKCECVDEELQEYASMSPHLWCVQWCRPLLLVPPLLSISSNIIYNSNLTVIFLVSRLVSHVKKEQNALLWFLMFSACNPSVMNRALIIQS